MTGNAFEGITSVKFGGVEAASFTVDSSEQIKAVVPVGAATGRIRVCVDDVYGESATDFTVLVAPKVRKTGPRARDRGAVITVLGSGFCLRRGSSVVKFGAATCGTYLSWTTNRIQVRVPARAHRGKVRVTVRTAGGVSNAVRFTVK